MNCIIVDDEPLAREAMKLLIEESSNLQLIGSFNSASTASDFMEQHVTDLVFLDIQMPGITGIEFARTISKKTLVIFTTAYTEYALDSYEVDAIDYLIKPVEAERFQKAVDKALSYHSLLLKEEKEAIEMVVTADYFFVKAERRYFKVNFSDILFIIFIYKADLSLFSELVLFLIRYTWIIKEYRNIKLRYKSFHYSRTAWTTTAVQKKLRSSYIFSGFILRNKYIITATLTENLRWCGLFLFFKSHRPYLYST